MPHIQKVKPGFNISKRGQKITDKCAFIRLIRQITFIFLTLQLNLFCLSLKRDISHRRRTLQYFAVTQNQLIRRQQREHRLTTAIGASDRPVLTGCHDPTGNG